MLIVFKILHHGINYIDDDHDDHVQNKTMIVMTYIRMEIVMTTKLQKKMIDICWYEEKGGPYMKWLQKEIIDVFADARKKCAQQ